MTKTHKILRNRLLKAAGVVDKQPSLSELRQTEWCDEFEKLMRNRLLMGALRYGRLNACGKPKYDRIESLIKRAALYRKTGNVEHLVDMANMCMLEFVEGEHPNRHFSSIDDGDHHTRKK